MSASLAILPYQPLSSGPQSMSGTIKEFVLPAFTKLMRPLVQILLRNGIAFGEFAEILKRLYVETAVSTFNATRSPITESKVALATGLPRTDVARLLGEPPLDIEALEAQTNRVGRILTCWHQEPDFTGPYGFPLELPFEADLGRRSFVELVRRAGGSEIEPHELLEELDRVGAVAVLENGLVRVLARSYVPSLSDPAVLEFMSVAFTDLAATLDRNLGTAHTPKFFERRVWTPHGIPVTDVAEFQEIVASQGQEFLEKLDDWLTARESEGVSSDVRLSIVGVGTYMFQRDGG
jgi:hypothetical protein